MARAPAQQAAAELHHEAVRDEAGDADHDHAADDDLGARELARLHDDGAEPGLRPNMIMARGSQAVTGIGRITWKVGSSNWRTTGMRPIIRPIGSATAAASAKPP